MASGSEVVLRGPVMAGLIRAVAALTAKWSGGFRHRRRESPSRHASGKHIAPRPTWTQ